MRFRTPFKPARLAQTAGPGRPVVRPAPSEWERCRNLERGWARKATESLLSDVSCSQKRLDPSGRGSVRTGLVIYQIATFG